MGLEDLNGKEGLAVRLKDSYYVNIVCYARGALRCIALSNGAALFRPGYVTMPTVL